MSRRTRFQWHGFKRFHLLNSGKQRPLTRQPLNRRLQFEPLEDRRLLATVAVTTLLDTVNANDGVTSLREAVFATNLTGGTDVIEFATSLTSGGPATITLTQGELKITDSLSIIGPGANLLTIDASGSDPTPNENNGDGSRIFNIDEGINSVQFSVAISGLTLTGGDSANSGGAIFKKENLVLTNCTISGNSALGGGGGIASYSGEPVSYRGSLTITGCTISGNFGGFNGGGIFNALHGTLTVSNSTITGNTVSTKGGGVFNYGPATFTNSTISDNTVSGPLQYAGGGGIWSGGKGDLTLINSDVSGNSARAGGGVYFNTAAGGMSVTNSTIRNNSALVGGGGGISFHSWLSMTITGSTISNNSAGADGGGILTGFGTVSLTGSTVSGNTAVGDGGGIYKGAGSNLTISSSTFSKNSAARGGGMFVTRQFPIASLPGTDTLVTNSTLSGNSATGSGGGAYLFATSAVDFTFRHSTIAFNTAGGVGGGITAFGGSLTLNQSIVAKNTAALGADLTRQFGGVNARYSLVGDNSGTALVETPSGTTDANGNKIGGPTHGLIDPLLGSLTDNAGPMPTHALLPGSPALDAGDPSAVAGVGTVPPRDQRGAPFVRVIGGRIDIGAYERQMLPALSLIVDTLVDENDGNYSAGDFSLREAIALANGSVGGDDVITFAPGLAGGTIRLVLGELAIFDAVTINGLGPGLLAIDASGNDPTPDSTLDDGISTNDGDGSRIFNIDDGVSASRFNVSISGLTLKGGDARFDGGAILSRENLSVTGCTITGNVTGTSTSDEGGAIYSSGSLTITACTISGNASRGDGGAIRTTGSNLPVIIVDSTLSGNISKLDGGAISTTSANVSITNSTLSNNNANGGTSSDGGAIWMSSGTMIVANSTINGNSAPGGGGGISKIGGTLTVTGSSITNNSAISTSTIGISGGGIRNSSGDLSIADSTISGNSSNRHGGGIYMSASNTLTVTNCIVSGNTASLDGAGIWKSTGNLIVTGSTISGNTASRDGAGIWKNTGTLLVTDSTLSGNSATSDGGGISSRASLIMTGSTLSGNRSTAGSGGGLHLFGTTASTFTIRHSTIVSNITPTSGMGGGIFLVGGTMTLDHTILASNSATVGPDLARLIETTVNPRFSLIGTGAGGGLVEASVGSPDANGNLIGGPVKGTINPLLGPLANNGGPTQTHSLLKGSPALEAGDINAVAGGGTVPLFDQRGAPFSRVFDGDGINGARIDLGAYENRPITHLVDTLADESDGDYSLGDFSLREALVAAKETTNPEEDIIKFSPVLTNSGPATILLKLGELVVLNALSIVGPGADKLAIDASGNDSTPDANDGNGSRVFNVDDGNNSTRLEVLIHGLTLTGGDVSGNVDNDGGAIRTVETLTVSGCTIYGNSGVLGGGISSGGTNFIFANLTVIGSTIRDNADAGIWSVLGNTTVIGSTISGNSNGGFKGGGTLTVTNSTFSGNSALGSGGGIEGNNVIVTDSTISGNTASAGGGIWGHNVTVTRSTISANKAVATGPGFNGSGGGINGYVVTVIDSTIVGNSADSTAPLQYQGRGGGICSEFASGTLTVKGSAIVGNSARDGGGIWSNTDLTGTRVVEVVNSTVSGNTAANRGGGFYNFDGLTSIRFSTVTGNTSLSGVGSGVASYGDTNSKTQIQSSIVAGNTGSDVAIFLGGVNSFASLGHNVVGVGNGSSAFGQSSDKTNILDPKVGPLADNGGRTKTHALLTGSPAINAGDSAATPGVGNVPLNDQRGEPFTRVYGGQIDIGAFEVQPIPPAFYGDYNQDGSADMADYIVWRKMLGNSVAPYSSADGDGNGVINENDYGVWRTHFGQTWLASAAGSGAIATVEEVQSASHATATTGETLANSQASESEQLHELQGATDDRLANATLEPSRVGLIASAALHSDSYRSAARSSLRATNANRNDDALLAWLSQPESKRKVKDRSERTCDNEQTSSTDEFHSDVRNAKDEVFAFFAAT